MTETTATSVTLTWDSGNSDPISYYVIQYKPKSLEGQFQEVDGVATTRYSIGGLSPFSEYEFQVIAVNNIGRGPPSELVEARTGEQAPSSPPLKVQARMLSASTMLVRWEQPEEPNGQIRGYRVYYTTDAHLPLSMWQKHNTDDSHFTTVGSLITGTTYSIRVLAFTSVGDGPPSDIIQVKTQQGGTYGVRQHGSVAIPAVCGSAECLTCTRHHNCTLCANDCMSERMGGIPTPQPLDLSCHIVLGGWYQSLYK